MTPDLWAPLGAAGGTPVVEQLTAQRKRETLPHTAQVQLRALVPVGGVTYALVWYGRTLVAHPVGADGSYGAEVLRAADREWGTLAGSVVWDYSLMPVDVGGERLDVERRAVGRNRFTLDVTSRSRRWTWTPEGRVLADRMALRRADDVEPVVVHTIRPVPGKRRSEQPTGDPEVCWDARATTGEVLISVAWLLEGQHSGLLPKLQRVRALEFL